MLDSSWQKQWTAYLDSIPGGKPRTPAQDDTRRNRAHLHATLPKATSALITQIRTEKIGLNAFLTERRVPGYSAGCPCGSQRQTAKHIIMHCPNYSGDRDDLFRTAGTRDYKKMLATTRGAKAAAYFLQRTGLLDQFQLGLGPEPE
jgi:hypothetical protein